MSPGIRPVLPQCPNGYFVWTFKYTSLLISEKPVLPQCQRLYPVDCNPDIRDKIGRSKAKLYPNCPRSPRKVCRKLRLHLQKGHSTLHCKISLLKELKINQTYRNDEYSSRSRLAMPWYLCSHPSHCWSYSGISHSNHKTITLVNTRTFFCFSATSSLCT